MNKSKNPLHCFVNGAGGRSASSIVVELLSYGQQNATPRRELEKMTGWSGRMVRLAIERERRHGVPILSDNSNGYYLPGNSAERAQFVRSMRNRAAEILKTAAAVESSGKG